MYCKNCGIETRGSLNICPLCHNTLRVGADGGGDAIDVYPLRFKRAQTRRRITFDNVFWFAFFNIVSVCVLINVFFETEFWSFPVAVGLIYIYVLVKNTILSSSDTSIKLFFQTVALSVFFIALLFFFDDRSKIGWIIDYVLPIIYAASALTYGVLIFIRVNNFSNYILYEFFVLLLGVIPTLLAEFGKDLVGEKTPSYVCLFVCIFVFMSNIIFSWKFIRHEMKKRFHV
ncbi:MAG: DUF6320 domain-containing protein [Clostridiales bacterium]|jgi:hypothetical protein|nr:DUF6320 domain-containing protein [Clostridiales bacterium]